MGEKRGCFKTGCLGCLGLFVVIVIITAVIAGIAWKDSGNQDPQDRQLAPEGTVVEARPADPTAPDAAWRTHPGRLVLELGQGEFILRPAPEGEGLSARARFDAEVHSIEEHFEVMPDSTWVYGIRFQRHMPGMQALFRSIFGGDMKSEVQVFIPEGVPITLEVLVEEGGFEAELGGLWVTDADIRYNKGGFELSFDEPLQEPMNSLSIKGAMGGFSAVNLGNASPANLVVDCKMGGADVDLGGLWLQDCDASFSVRMGGMAVGVPRDVIVEGPVIEGIGMHMPDGESPVPTIRMKTSQSMGEIEVMRR